MDNGFDYMNDFENTPEQPAAPQPAEEPAQQPEPAYEPAPQEPVYPHSDDPYSYTYSPTSEPVAEPKPAPEPKPKKKKSGKGILIAISIIAGILLIANIVMLAGNAKLQEALDVQRSNNQALNNRLNDLENQIDDINRNTQSGGATTTPGTPSQPTSSSDLLTPQQVYAQNVKAVVAVSSEGVTTNIYGQVSKTASTGSGFIVSEDGFVVTNYHVIQGGNQFSVITFDEQEHKATVIGYDKTNDVAVLKLEGTGFHYVQLGDSDELQVGDQVMAIGNPLGELTSTLTVGYVSAKDRMVSTDGTAINMLQTDAAINSGNSGGPLFNAKGEVIGINTAKYSGTSSSGATIEGIGFAIPITDVRSIIDDLQSQGYVSSAYLGVMVKEVDSSAQSYGLPAGVYVDEVAEGYCAEAAGVQEKDIIIALGEHKIDSFSALSRALRRFEAGETTTITVYRSGQEVTMEITLDEKPLDQQTTTTEPQEQETTPNNGGGFSYPDIWDYFFGG